MAPTPPNSGLSTRCAPVKYNDSSPPRMIAGLSAATLDAPILPADYWDAGLTIVCRRRGAVNVTASPLPKEIPKEIPKGIPEELGGLGAHQAGAACQHDHVVERGGQQPLARGFGRDMVWVAGEQDRARRDLTDRLEVGAFGEPGIDDHVIIAARQGLDAGRKPRRRQQRIALLSSPRLASRCNDMNRRQPVLADN